MWMLSSEREKQRMTVVSRLSRVELQVSCSTFYVYYSLICIQYVSIILPALTSVPSHLCNHPATAIWPYSEQDERSLAGDFLLLHTVHEIGYCFDSHAAQ